MSGAGLAITSDWFLVVRDAGGTLRVVARTGTPLDWRPLSNVLRGPQLRVAQGLVEEALETGALASGAGFALPVHLDGTDLSVAFLSLADPDPDVPPVLLWQWEFRHAGVPPVLRMSPTAACVWGLTERIDSRGPADFYSVMANLQDALSHLNFLYSAPVLGRRRSQIPVVGRDGAPALIEAYEVVRESEGRRVVSGVGWQTVRDCPKALNTHRLADAAAWNILVSGDSDRIVVATDMRFSGYPYVLKWMSPPPSGMLSGRSQGVDRAVLHPDDVKELSAVVADHHGGADHAGHRSRMRWIRVRRDGGGWLRARGRGFPLDEDNYPTVWLWLLDVQHPHDDHEPGPTSD